MSRQRVHNQKPGPDSTLRDTPPPPVLPGKPQPLSGAPALLLGDPGSPHRACCVMTLWTCPVIASQCPGVSGGHQAACWCASLTPPNTCVWKAPSSPFP